MLPIPAPFFYGPGVSWDPHHVPFHYLGKADFLYPHFLPQLLLRSKLLVIKDHLPLFHIELQHLLMCKAACVKARNVSKQKKAAVDNSLPNFIQFLNVSIS